MFAQKELTHAEWREKDTRYYLHPFTEYKNLATEKDCRVMAKAEGVRIYDCDGKAYIDGMSGLWCSSLGYSNPSITEAVARQMNSLPYYNSFFKTSNTAATELAERLISIAPSNMRQVFFTSSGSEAIDSMIRLSRHYWSLKGQPKKRILISRKNAYHGSTMGGASLGGMQFMHEQGGLPIPDITHVEQPYSFELGHGEDPTEFGKRIARTLETKIQKLGAENVAAFVGEPVQGAGGVIIPPSGYWQEIQRICKQYDILLIADEVITGFCRTGNWFGSHSFGIVPDMMVFAKAVSAGYLPLGGLLVGERVSEALMNSPKEFAHGFTYSGHPVPCAAALEALHLMEKMDLNQRVQQEIGPYFAEKLNALADHPIVGEARSYGMLGAIELVADKKTRRRLDADFTMGATCRDLCMESGIISRAVRDSMIMAPPLIIEREDLDEFFAIMGNCLDKTAEKLKLA